MKFKLGKLDMAKQIEDSKKYLFESRKYIYFSVLLFFLSSLISFMLPASFSFLDELIREIFLSIEGMGGIELTFFIMQNNIQSAFFGLVLGIFLGIPSIINLLLNGLVIGYVMSLAVGAQGFLVFWRLIPHGIFELPAIFISLALGIKLGTTLFSKHPGEFKRRLYNSLNVFLVIVLPLLFVAAIIEGVLIALGS